jgi:hypothetical protein
VCEIQIIKIKEVAEKGRSWQGEPSDEERHENNSFVSVRCWNGDPMPDSPGTQLLRWQNPGFDKVQEIGLKNNRHMVTDKWKLAIRIDGRNNWNSSTLSLPLAGHRNLLSEVGRLKNSENREAAEGKSKS